MDWRPWLALIAVAGGFLVLSLFWPFALWLGLAWVAFALLRALLSFAAARALGADPEGDGHSEWPENAQS